jgi:hypothetical protein
MVLRDGKFEVDREPAVTAKAYNVPYTSAETLDMPT